MIGLMNSLFQRICMSINPADNFHCCVCDAMPKGIEAHNDPATGNVEIRVFCHSAEEKLTIVPGDTMELPIKVFKP